MLQAYLQSIELSREQTARALAQFSLYRDLLLQRNKEVNLTAITDPAEVDTKHFIDSLLGLPFVYGSVADIGTGAGFPALPLKIVRPQLHVTLIDALQKRVCFLQDVIRRLDLTKTDVLHARAEDLSRETPFDCVVSRAVAPLSTLAEYCLPFVKTGGRMVAYKSAACEDELHQAANAIDRLGGSVESVVSVPLYGTDVLRKLILIKKVKPTPKGYPRGQNKPKKQPL